MYSRFFLCFCIVGQQAHAMEPLVTADMKPVHDELYTGEIPYLRVVLTNSGKEPIRVVPWQHLVSRGRLHCELTGPTGVTLKSPVGTVGIGLPLKNDDAVPLLAGRLLDYDMIPVFCRPSLPGDYTLKCYLRPLHHQEEYVVKKEIKIRYIDVPAERIKENVSFQVPPQQGVPNPFRGRVDLINAKGRDGYELLYRKIRVRENGEEHYLKRVLLLEENSKLVGIPKFFEKQDFVQEIWVAFNKGSEGYVVRIEFSTGALLEVLNMMQAFEQFNKNKN